MKTTIPLQQVARILRQHVGRENAITAPQIAAAIGRPASFSREIRRIIAANADWFWDQDINIVAVSGKGFYLGDDIEQFQAYRDYLTGLGLSIQKKLQSLDTLCRKRGIKLRSKPSQP